jgi:hypothetical protein
MVHLLEDTRFVDSVLQLFLSHQPHLVHNLDREGPLALRMYSQEHDTECSLPDGLQDLEISKSTRLGGDHRHHYFLHSCRFLAFDTDLLLNIDDWALLRLGSRCVEIDLFGFDEEILFLQLGLDILLVHDGLPDHRQPSFGLLGCIRAEDHRFPPEDDLREEVILAQSHLRVVVLQETDLPDEDDFSTLKRCSGYLGLIGSFFEKRLRVPSIGFRMR